MEICVTIKEIEECLEGLNSNKKYLIINNNLFSIDKIITMKAPIKNSDTVFINTSFEFSYDDCCKKDVIKIIYVHEDDECVSFVKTCKLISDAEREEIWKRSIDIANERRQDRYRLGLINSKEVDNIFYNEVLVYVSSKINENDKSNLKDDFISKYELFVEKKNELTNKTIDAINKLYSKIITIKLIGE